MIAKALKRHRQIKASRRPFVIGKFAPPHLAGEPQERKHHGNRQRIPVVVHECAGLARAELDATAYQGGQPAFDA